MRASVATSAAAMTATTILLLGGARVFAAQSSPQPDSRQPEKTPLANGVDRLAGTESVSKIEYVRLILSGSLSGNVAGDPSVPPTLIAQCTLRPNGRSYFELFANSAELLFRRWCIALFVFRWRWRFVPWRQWRISAGGGGSASHGGGGGGGGGGGSHK